MSEQENVGAVDKAAVDYYSLPALDGELTREQRVQIAKDVIAQLESKGRKIKVDKGHYLRIDDSSYDELGGQFNSTKFKKCEVCARGAFFLAAVDRFNKCEVGFYDDLNDIADERSVQDLGEEQACEIETAFECDSWFYGSEAAKEFGKRYRNHRRRLIAIMQNIIENQGEFRP